MSINMVQELLVEVDSTELLKRYLQLALETVFWNTERISVRAVDYKRDVKVHESGRRLEHCPSDSDLKRNFPIILVGASSARDTIEMNGYPGTVIFSTPGKAIEQAIDYIEVAIVAHGPEWATLFRSWFSPDDFDGSSGVGFKIYGGSLSRVLTIGLTYMEYHQ